mmetsp:Transcript_12974/g.33109  ORF Transcript_12974/g.33109 Transcript_12974/m.33109 type:complete len:94 (-) Transcript_12974:164-445(-)
MPPNAESEGESAAAAEALLRQRIELIASAAKTRNPTGFRGAPASPAPSERSYSSSASGEDVSYCINTTSGQMIQLLDSARNTDRCYSLQPVCL